MGSNKANTMVMERSKSGKGVFMVTPSKDKNVYANLDDMMEFCRGERSWVTFTISKRDTTQQMEIEDRGHHRI